MLARHQGTLHGHFGRSNLIMSRHKQSLTGMSGRNFEHCNAFVEAANAFQMCLRYTLQTHRLEKTLLK